MIGADRTRRGGSLCLDIDQVFERYRDAVQRSSIVASRNLFLCSSRLDHRKVMCDCDERVQFQIQELDSRQTMFCVFNRRQLPSTNSFRGLAQSQLMYGGHEHSLNSKP